MRNVLVLTRESGRQRRVVNDVLKGFDKVPLRSEAEVHMTTGSVHKKYFCTQSHHILKGATTAARVFLKTLLHIQQFVSADRFQGTVPSPVTRTVT